MKKIVMCALVLLLALTGCRESKKRFFITNVTETTSSVLFVPPQGSTAVIQFEQEEEILEKLGIITELGIDEETEEEFLVLEVEKEGQKTFFKIFLSKIFNIDLVSLNEVEEGLAALDIYDLSGGLCLKSKPKDVVFDTQRVLTDDFSHDTQSAEVIINKTARYVVSLRVSVTEEKRSFKKDGFSKFNILRDSGEGFEAVSGATLLIDHAFQFGEGKATTSGTFILDLKDGDVLKVTAAHIGKSKIKLTAAGSSLVIFELK